MGTCPKCKEIWSGLAIAHCSGCHKTFKSVNAFSKHRVGNECLDPESLGMEMSEKGYWRVPFVGGEQFWGKKATEGEEPEPEA